MLNIVKLFCTACLGLISMPALATTVTPSVANTWMGFLEAGEVKSFQEPAINILKTAGKIVTQVTIETSGFGQSSLQVSYLNCQLTFSRYLERPMNGPINDRLSLVTPFITDGANVNGSTSITRTYIFDGVANHGIFTKVSCSQQGTAKDGNTLPQARVEIVTTVYTD